MRARPQPIKDQGHRSSVSLAPRATQRAPAAGWSAVVEAPGQANAGSQPLSSLVEACAMQFSQPQLHTASPGGARFAAQAGDSASHALVCGGLVGYDEALAGASRHHGAMELWARRLASTWQAARGAGVQRAWRWVSLQENGAVSEATICAVCVGRRAIFSARARNATGLPVAVLPMCWACVCRASCGLGGVASSGGGRTRRCQLRFGEGGWVASVHHGVSVPSPVPAPPRTGHDVYRLRRSHGPSARGQGSRVQICGVQTAVPPLASCNALWMALRRCQPAMQQATGRLPGVSTPARRRGRRA